VTADHSGKTSEGARQNRLAVVIAACLVTVAPSWAQTGVSPGSEERSQREAEFQQSLTKLAAYSPDFCGPPDGPEENGHTADLENRLFNQAEALVAEGLNAAASGSPQERATGALSKLEKMSAETNAAWPEENRFHFEVLDLAPAVLVKMSVRTHESFFVFGIPTADTGSRRGAWLSVGSADPSVAHDVPQLHLQLFLLHRGPSGNPRFLAAFELLGCAGSYGVAYYAHEWAPAQLYTGLLSLLIRQTGSFGLESEAGFPPAGKLRTEGAAITLPYCWFSAIDTWDNPKLCAADTYDIGGDRVRFVSRIYNRPDLVPVAKAIEYAENKDLGAVLGYCTSEHVAKQLIRAIPPDAGFADELRVTPAGTGKEHVELGVGPAYRFDVEKHGDRWLVAAFKAE
jgi:hypothetical protein